MSPSRAGLWRFPGAVVWTLECWMVAASILAACPTPARGCLNSTAGGCPPAPSEPPPPGARSRSPAPPAGLSLLAAGRAGEQADRPARPPVNASALRGLQEVPQSHPACRISKTEKCHMRDMRGDEITMVYPGGSTRCLFSTFPEYAFQVVPGRTDKLLLHFQGGGACWDDLSTNVIKPRPCVTDPKLQPLCGIFDRTRASSPFRDYTVVHVQDCTGDLHAGDATRWYLDPRGVPVKQRGFHNAKSAIDWAKANLDLSLTSLIVSGCSSGAVGAQLWAAPILQQFKYQSAAVLADSYAGVLPERAQGSLLKNMGICKARLLGEHLSDVCKRERLAIPDAFDRAMKLFPKVTFASINSKSDWSQIEFYKAIAQQNLISANMSASSYLNMLNAILERHNDNANYVSYLVTGTDDGFLPKPLLYTTDTSGANGTQDGQEVGGRMPLAAWLAKLPVDQGGSVASECSGPVLTKGDWSGAAYCDAALAGKVFAPGAAAAPPRPRGAAAAPAPAPAPAPALLVPGGVQAGCSWGPAYYLGLGLITCVLLSRAGVESCHPPRSKCVEGFKRSRSVDLMSSDSDTELPLAPEEGSWSDDGHLAQPLHAPAGPLPPLRPLAPSPALAPSVLRPPAPPAMARAPAATGAPAAAAAPLRLAPPTQALASPPAVASPVRVASPPAAASPVRAASPLAAATPRPAASRPAGAVLTPKLG